MDYKAQKAHGQHKKEQTRTGLKRWWTIFINNTHAMFPNSFFGWQVHLWVCSMLPCHLWFFNGKKYCICTLSNPKQPLLVWPDSHKCFCALTLKFYWPFCLSPRLWICSTELLSLGNLIQANLYWIGISLIKILAV